jgi:hypothetical protein
MLGTGILFGDPTRELMMGNQLGQCASGTTVTSGQVVIDRLRDSNLLLFDKKLKHIHGSTKPKKKRRQMASPRYVLCHGA